jgi:hypothetical protein
VLRLQGNASFTPSLLRKIGSVVVILKGTNAEPVELSKRQRTEIKKK